MSAALLQLREHFEEVSPRFDSDDNTAKLAAVFVYALVNTLAPSRS